MLNDSRIDIYDYLYGLFHGVVTDNVYVMEEPQELTQSDTKDGFLVIRVGSIADESEFTAQAYGVVRCYVQAYVPLAKRGRLNRDKFKMFEDGIIGVIRNAANNGTGAYSVQEEEILSSDVLDGSNANNSYLCFIKSFLVVIDNNE